MEKKGPSVCRWDGKCVKQADGEMEQVGGLEKIQDTEINHTV